jgi:5-oxoprolinase (ATP-hydrolysing)
MSLACFGGAGGQHACLVADALGMTTVMIHPFAGVLSAYGMGLADLRRSARRRSSGRSMRRAISPMRATLAERGRGRAAGAGRADGLGRDTAQPAGQVCRDRYAAASCRFGDARPCAPPSRTCTNAASASPRRHGAWWSRRCRWKPSAGCRRRRRIGESGASAVSAEALATVEVRMAGAGPHAAPSSTAKPWPIGAEITGPPSSARPPAPPWSSPAGAPRRRGT